MPKPTHFTQTDNVIMSNFDHIIDLDVKDQVQNGEFYAHYPGWNFTAYVWYENDEWCAEIWRYHSLTAEMHNKELSELKTEICDIYGYD